MKEMRRNLDECLSIRNGRLFVEECDTVDLVKRFGSPLYVISENHLRRNIRRYKKAFEDRWPEGKAEILPAIKANWVLALRRILSEEGAGCDVYSAGELYAVLQSGADPQKVSVNGGGKNEAHIANCINAGVRITIDDIDELDLIEKVANQLNKKARIRFRIRPSFPNLWEPTAFAMELAPIDIGFQVYKNGIPTEHVIEMGKRALKMKNIEVMGFHIHLGRHHGSLGYWKGTMKRYAKLMAQLKEEWGGYEPKEIDIGGGIPTPRDPFARLVNRLDVPVFAVFFVVMLLLKLLGNKIRYKILSVGMSMLLSKTPNKTRAPEIEEYAEAITGTLRKSLVRYGINPKGITFQIEPGRSLYGDTGVHLSTILKTKHQTTPVKYNWVLLDTTYFFMAGGVFELNLHDFVIANKADEKNVMTADVVGRSCFADRMLPEVRLPRVAAGDIMAILDTGAYQEVSASNFNGLPRPATVLVNGDQAEVIKRAETQEDVFARDIIPKRLMKNQKS